MKLVGSSALSEYLTLLSRPRNGCAEALFSHSEASGYPQESGEWVERRMLARWAQVTLNIRVDPSKLVSLRNSDANLDEMIEAVEQKSLALSDQTNRSLN